MVELAEVDEAELQRVVAAEKQKAQFTAQVHHFMELCWDKCVEKPGNCLDSRTENRLSSCVDHFIDTILAITSWFAQIVQKGGQLAIPWKNDRRSKGLVIKQIEAPVGERCQPTVRSTSGYY
ncbi:mitochondrial import inner membrane translocase subunit Tim8 B-like [Molossus molossus]|uniref:mitochondrial import inner membrane translocase subunit Tim8 B-like n=1 Tax=Molossus molossus TaxID=27622 RepID=UPI0017469442|nr:mitochondrial import inner membrane translocase subunit Tim8 B-like [Molossus molossus]